MNNTKNRKNVRNAGNANSTRTFVISDPDAKATDNQRRAIAHAVKNGSLPRFAEEEWKNLSKGRASEIIDELRTREGDPLATWGQKPPGARKSVFWSWFAKDSCAASSARPSGISATRRSSA